MRRQNQLSLARNLFAIPNEKSQQKAAMIFSAWRTLKARAALKLSSAILCGAMRQARNYYCVDCGKRAECYDHRDYAKPFEVAPVCKSCNSRRGSAKQVFSDWKKWDSLGLKILKTIGDIDDFYAFHVKYKSVSSGRNRYKPLLIYKHRYKGKNK